MLLNVVDANGATQRVSVPSPGTATDASGVILADLPITGPPFTHQQLLPSSPGFTRAGWWLRNRATHPMYISEDGTVPSSTNPTTVIVYPGEVFPSPGIGYPITQNVVLLVGTPGDSFSAKAW